jgi:WXXGXW repeat (2 copies)
MNRDGAFLRRMLLAIIVLSFSAASFAQIGVGISVRVGPPPLPVYAQPLCPGPGYTWAPGYWGWHGTGGYYWIPGTWVVAPVGMLWTPGYWGWGGGVYAWHAGYWGPHVGFYGGINYGFGYGGVGFVGGEWRGGAFYYNRYVTNVSVTSVTHVYNRSVVVNDNHAAFNGGEGGVEARPTPQEEAAAREPHTAPLAAQSQHEQAASQNHENFASENHGRPAVAATSRPGDFSTRSAVPARSAGGEYHAPAMSPQEARVGSTGGTKAGSSEGFHSFSKTSASNSPEPTKTTQSNPPKANHSKPAAQHKSSPAPHKQSAPKGQHNKGK